MADITFTECAWEDYLYWQTQDRRTLRKINALLKDILREPFFGEGKPEPLRNAEGDWSRRINEKDRLVYRVVGDVILVKQCKGHYGDK